MCNPASFVVTKGSVFWSRISDGHEDIIKEHGLVEMVAGSVTLVRVEITPPDGDMRITPRKWVFNVDQDILPEWFVAKTAEKRCRLALKDWYKAKVLTAGCHHVTAGMVWARGRAVVHLYKEARAQAFESSRVHAVDRANVDAFDKAQITASHSTTVNANDKSTVFATQNARVIAFGSPTVELRNRTCCTAGEGVTVHLFESAEVFAYGSTVHAGSTEGGKITAAGTSTVHVAGTGIVCATQSCKVYAKGYANVFANDEATVDASGMSTVHARGAGKVKATGSATVILSGSGEVDVSENAVLVDRTCKHPSVQTAQRKKPRTRRSGSVGRTTNN